MSTYEACLRDTRPCSAIYHHNDLPNVARVTIRGPQRDFTADLLGYGVGATGVGNPRQITLLANCRLYAPFSGVNLGGLENKKNW
jgi:hypothetical protein